ncbi:MAG: hypothetical protein E2O35_05335 [Proteobacteria bacterium]|nr:MAG: hypothetical protein E2O35_05335 [Pseudomonadota bacterium]
MAELDNPILYGDHPIGNATIPVALNVRGGSASGLGEGQWLDGECCKGHDIGVAAGRMALRYPLLIHSRVRRGVYPTFTRQL